MYLYGTTFHLSLLPLCIFIIVLDIYGWVVTLVIAKDNCSWAMRSNYLFVVTYLSIIFEFHPYTSYLDHECLFVDFSFFLYNYIALISPHHKIISPEGITSPERQKHRISQYTYTYTHICICKPNKIRIMYKQYCFRSSIIPDVKKIYTPKKK